MESIISKTGILSRLILRRDRIRIPLWLIGILFFTFIVPPAFLELYPTQQERDVFAQTVDNPVITAMTGPVDFASYTIGVMTAHEMLLITAIVVGLMNILLLARNTRADEEDGRIEMVRALPVGRLSNLNAAMVVLFLTNLLLALITGVGLYAMGIESMGLEGSMLYGATLGATGFLFAGITGLFAQITETSRGTIGFSIAALLILYMVRAIGDVSMEALSWISPLGWVPKTEVYYNNNWWPIAFMLVLSITLVVIANYLNAIRDLGAGFLPSRPGKKAASPMLLSPVGLALRLQRTGIISWGVAMIFLGSSYGSIMGDLETFFQDNDMMKQMLADVEGYTLTEQFIPALMVVMSLLAAVPPVMAMNRLYGEEKKNRIEHILGRAVSRTKLMVSYIVIAIVNAFVMLSLTGIGLWAAGDSVMEEPFEFGMVYGATLAYLPAVLVMIGVSVLLIGLKPRLVSVVWGYVLYSFFVLYLGNMFQFPEWVGKISPFGHIPQLPVEDMSYTPIVILTIIAIGLMITGIVGYNRRDIEG